MTTAKDFFNVNNPNPSSFKRIIGPNEFIYENGKIISKQINRKVQYIKPISKSLYRKKLFITLDVKTKNINGLFQLVAISIYDGFKPYSFLISDYNSGKEGELEMVKDTFNILKSRKYNYQRIFIHNTSNFDFILLLNYLAIIGTLKPLMRDGVIYNIRLEMVGNKGNRYVLNLRDYLLFLPASLEKLGKSFKIENPKTIFPLKALNDYPLDYKGIIPPKNSFKNITDEEYKKYIKNHPGIWELKKELKKYCENNVIALHQIINKFSLEIFNLFRVDITKYYSLSSVAFAIYRSNFLFENKIPKITGKMYQDIYKSYKRGLVEIFIPEGENLYLVDVNYEYPEIICLDMPGGKVKYFEGDLDLNEPKNFGFFQAEIIANENLTMPVLPVKYKNSTFCPIGQWTDWYFSEELKEAQNKYGYKIKVLKGYIFERVKIFTNYVNFLYSIKEKTDKDDPKYSIIKFILNMLYGKFGMKPDKDKTIIQSSIEAENLYSNPDILIKDVIDIGNGNEILRTIEKKKLVDEYDLFSSNIYIAIFSAVVSYGRIKINELKHLEGIKVLYSDTNSLVINKPLPQKFMGTKLGQLKLVDFIKIGYFISPNLIGYLNGKFENIVKNKRFKGDLFFYELYFLLYRNTIIKKEHDKLFKNLADGNIIIKNEIFFLSTTYNKRQLIYNSANKLVGTKPYYYYNGYILNDPIDYILNISPSKNKLITFNENIIVRTGEDCLINNGKSEDKIKNIIKGKKKV